MPDLCFMPAHQLQSKLLAKDISARELLDVFIAQTQKHNPTINALVTLNIEPARKQAIEADQQLAQHGKPIGPLHGLPIAVKDVFATRNLRTTLGNEHFAKHIPTQDDLLVAREKAAGAIILGKSNTPDCASGGMTSNTIFGLTRNPWNLEKTTSGSGGGGVASLMSGMVCMADGSDIGGSIRSPAAWSNCVGFRPSSGRIPGFPGSLADGNTSTAGAFTRCVKDTALFMQACDGADVHCATPYPVGETITLDKLDKKPKGITAAWSVDFANRDMAPEIGALFETHSSVFEGFGLSLSTTPVHLGKDYRKLYTDFNAYGYVKGLPTKVLHDCLEGKPVKSSIKENVEHYMRMSAQHIFEMFKAREVLRVNTQIYMQKHEVIITPAHSCLAYGATDKLGQSLCDWSAFYLAPLLGLPSIVVPCGFTKDGMPSGVMITGRKGDDLLVLQIAAAFEGETNYGKKLPKLFS
ncbi:MAG: amidase [Oceanospirillaceae bacterium]|nr:amidase [Oceanospirillaceae bacterium]